MLESVRFQSVDPRMSGGDSGVSLTSCTEDGQASDCDSGTGGGHTVTIQVGAGT